MSDTSSDTKAKGPRSRLKYISTRLKELNEEKSRLVEERKALRAARPERGEGEGSPEGGQGGGRRRRKDAAAEGGSGDA